jgi:hypothetical protein
MLFLLFLSSVPSPRAKLLIPVVIWTTLQLLVAAVAAVPMALPGCPETCGSITVPYPFGFRQGCFHAGFNLTCDETHHPPKLFLGDGVEVDDISLPDSTMRLQSRVMNFSRSYTANGSSTVKPSIDSSGLWYGSLNGTGMQLAVSTEDNIFVAIGCNFVVYLVSSPDTVGRCEDLEHVSACALMCECDTGIPESGGTSCSGVGCCRRDIAQGLLRRYQLQLKDLGSVCLDRCC